VHLTSGPRTIGGPFVCGPFPLAGQVVIATITGHYQRDNRAAKGADERQA